MKFAIVAATSAEVEPTKQFLREQFPIALDKLEITVITTGIGVMDTTYQLTTYLKNHKPDFMIQGGIAGSFSDKFQPGQVVVIGEEVLGDLGACEEDDFKDVFDLGLKKASELPFTNKRLINPHLGNWVQLQLSVAKGLTVNEITTNPERIGMLKKKYACEVESMEGAAFHFVCLHEQIPFLQIRAISNYIGERDKKKWKLKEAIDNLNIQLIRIIQPAILS